MTTRTTAGKSMTRTPTNNTRGEAMNENTNTTRIPAEHEEELCSGGGPLCYECRAAGADFGDPA